MACKFFIVPIQDSEAAEAELNSFLQGHKVLDVERRWVDQGPNSFWSFCIDYLDRAASGSSRRSGRRSSVDYREVLNDEDFAIFAKLRDLRKEIALAEGAPVYTVFNNEQLAKMVQNKARTKADLEAIGGVGDAKVEKYGPRFLEFLVQQWDTSDETSGNLFKQIVDRENLRLALCKAMLGKRDRADARAFATHLEVRLSAMEDALWRGAFPLGRYHQFVIHDPKRRTITAPCFSERVLHHAIMNVCEPVFEGWLIHDTYACRVGRGRDAAIDRARYFARRHPFFLKMDIRKYFGSISHDILVARLERLFKDTRLVDLLERVIFSFQGDTGRGLPIGSLTSQHFANFYLGWFDRFVKQELRVKGYVRYMDDMLLWGKSAATMRVTLDRCREYLGGTLDLAIKPHPYINRTSHGVDFLGCRVLPDHVILNRRSRTRFRRKMAYLENLYVEGQIDEQELQDRGTALIAFTQAAGAKSWNFRRAVLQQLPVSGRRPRTG